MNKNKKTAVILDGQKIASDIRRQIKEEIETTGAKLGLAAILVGDNKASHLYVSLKEKACAEVGIAFHKYLCNSQCYDDIDETELLEMIDFLNRDNQINGILIQLPLPEGFDADKIIKKIDPTKDIDGFINNKITPPTIAAILELLKATEENLSNKSTLIIGNSDIFIDNIAKHLERLKIKKINKAKEIPTNCADYDVVIIALGQAHILKKENIKEGATIIDVGINKLSDKTVGDVDPEVTDKANFLSPVPGGVGPLTVACLLKNILDLSKTKK